MVLVSMSAIALVRACRVTARSQEVSSLLVAGFIAMCFAASSFVVAGSLGFAIG